MPKCNNCDKNALYQLPGGVLLCLDCYEKLARIQQTNIANLMAMENQLLDHMDEITGIPSYARYKIPQPIIYRDNKMQNFINVDKSIIGSINTGVINSLNQSMNNINNNINTELAKLLSQFTKAIIESKEIEDQCKNEVLEKLSFITEQIVVPGPQQKKSLVKSIFRSLKESLNSSASLITIWQTIQPFINQIFGNST